MIYARISEFPRKNELFGLERSKNWRLPTQLIIFLDFWAKKLEIAHPVNYSYLPPWISVIILSILLSLKLRLHNRFDYGVHMGNSNLRILVKCQSLTHSQFCHDLFLPRYIILPENNTTIHCLSEFVLTFARSLDLQASAP